MKRAAPEPGASIQPATWQRQKMSEHQENFAWSLDRKAGALLSRWSCSPTLCFCPSIGVALWNLEEFFRILGESYKLRYRVSSNCGILFQKKLFVLPLQAVRISKREVFFCCQSTGRAGKLNYFAAALGSGSTFVELPTSGDCAERRISAISSINCCTCSRLRSLKSRKRMPT